jgi:YYY domain-containing protein
MPREVAKIALMIAGRHAPPRANWTVSLALMLVWVAALSLRLFGLNWDQGQDLHPDELFVGKIVLVDRIRLEWPPDVANLLDPATSRMNARSQDPATGQWREFAYGSLPLYVTDFTAWLMGTVTGVNWNAGERVFLVGRFLSAVLDSFTAIVTFAIGARIAGRRAGLAAALLAALAPMMIQLSHFFTTDSWLAFFVAVCLWQCVVAVQDGGMKPLVLAGVASGLALATKGSVFTLFGIVAMAGLLQAMPAWQTGDRAGSARLLAIRGIAAGVAALLAFAIFEPYALAAPDIYIQSLRTQADIVRGRFDVPFTRHFVATGALHPIGQFVKWGGGPVFGLLSIAGVALLGKMAWRERSGPALLLLTWLVGYLLVILAAEVRFLRYLAPVVPVLAIAGGLALDVIWSRVEVRFGRRAGSALAAGLVAGCALWTFAFMTVYAGEHPRLAASRWMFDQIPPGSAISSEYWDDALPRNFDPVLNAQAFDFRDVPADMYSDRPPPETADALFGLLRDSDYIVLSSNRVQRSIDAAPWRYPVQIRFYELLQSGELGFSLAGEWSRPPRLGPLVFDDQGADESFINYDHPQVRIYQRDELIPRAAYLTLMTPALDRPWSPTRHHPGPTLEFDGPVGELPVVDDARWSAALSGSTTGAVTIWLALLIALQAAVLPLAASLFRRFPDRGWGFARLLALVVPGFVVWFGASVGLFSFRAVWCWVALLIAGGAAWGVWVRQRRRGRSLPLISRESAWAEAAFWLVFLVFLFFRVRNPDSWHPTWGGEKPMEFAQLNGILRSAHFPPIDPWFSDGYLNYYYYGIYLMAWLMKLGGIPSEIAFNLAQPTVMGLLASGVFSLGAALAGSITRRRRLALVGGVAAVVFTVLIGNLTTAARLFRGNLPPRSDFGAWVWDGSRAIENAITEFPFFSGLYADLHAHVIALPVTVLAIALSFALATSQPDRDRLPTLSRLALLSLALGTLSATNAWDVPVYGALAVASVWLATRHMEPLKRRMTWFAGGAVSLAAGSYLLFLPFHRSFVALFGSLAPVRDPTPVSQWVLHIGGLAAVVAAGLIAMQLPRRRLPQFRWLRAGTFVAVLLVAWFVAAVLAMILGHPVALLGLAATILVAAFSLAAAWVSAERPGVPEAERWVERLPVVFGGALVVIALLQGRTVLALVLCGLALAATGFLCGQSTPRRFVSLLAAAAFGVMAGVEIVVVADDLLGGPAYRMNTVFKFYNQVWILLAVAAAVLFAMAVASRPFRLAEERIARSWWSLAASLAVVVTVASLLYPIFAISPRLHQRFVPELGRGSLNGLGWMDEAWLPSLAYPDGRLTFADDRAIIDWFNADVAGTPVIAEATIGPYRCNGSRISIATGLPTILGWERHQSQQRYLSSLDGRAADVDRLYRSEDPQEKLEILRRYGVEYVVVGDLERAYPIASNECEATNPTGGIEAFERMVGDSLEIAFERGDSRVYRVLPEAAEVARIR